MSCDRCGRHTPRRRLCKLCQLDDRAEERDTEARLFECPECGVERTSGRGVTCSVCRSDREEPVADGGRDHHLAPAHRLVDEEIGKAVIVLDVSRNGAVRLSVDGDGYDRRRLSSEEIVEWFDSGRLHFEDPEEDAVLNPANVSNGGSQ